MSQTTIKDVITSFGKAIHADVEMRAARDNYTGYDWSYHGYELNKTCEECNEDAKANLDAYIAQQVAAQVAP